MSKTKRMQEDEKKQIEDAIEKTSKYHYQQSSKASELIRKIVFAIIGSCWVLIFANNGKYQEINIFLKITIAVSFIYLLLDVLHYFLDSCSYYHYSWDIYKTRSIEYIKKVYLPRQEHLDRRSFGLFCAKIGVGFIVAITFVIGMFWEPLTAL